MRAGTFFLAVCIVIAFAVGFMGCPSFPCGANEFFVEVLGNVQVTCTGNGAPQCYSTNGGYCCYCAN